MFAMMNLLNPSWLTEKSRQEEKRKEKVVFPSELSILNIIRIASILKYLIFT